MAVQDYKINYKSDFVLNINGDAGWAIPFCIKFWTGMPSQAYFVGFDGVKYVNCRVGDTPTQLLVMFDDHHLPIGPLRMQIAYHTTIEEFPGSVFDEVTNARDVIVTIDGTDYQVLLDFTGEDAPELEFDLPAYANEAERIQNELQRQQNEADRIAAELQREQATAAAVEGAENVNAQLAGNILTVTNRNGVSTSVNTKGEQGEQGPVGPQGPQGEQGVSIVDFSPKSQTETAIIYTATFSDGHTQDVAIPKGPKGDTGATGPTGPQGETGVSIVSFNYSSETDSDMIYTLTFSDGHTQDVAIPKGPKGDTGATGPQGNSGYSGAAGELEVVNNLTQGGATAALSAEMGKELSQSITIFRDTGFNPLNESQYNANLKEIRITVANGGFTAEVIRRKGTSTSIYVAGITCTSMKAGKTYNIEFDYVSGWSGYFMIRDASFNIDGSVFGSHTSGSGHVSVSKTLTSDSGSFTFALPQNTAVGQTLVISNFTITEVTSLKDKVNGIDAELNFNFKKQITPVTGSYYKLDVSIGSVANTIVSNVPAWQYARIPVEEGDVICITGNSGEIPRLWGYLGSDYTLLDVARASETGNKLVKVVPSGVSYVVINSTVNSHPQWYYAKAGSAGADELLAYKTQQKLDAVYEGVDISEQFVFTNNAGIATDTTPPGQYATNSRFTLWKATQGFIDISQYNYILVTVPNIYNSPLGIAFYSEANEATCVYSEASTLEGAGRIKVKSYDVSSYNYMRLTFTQGNDKFSCIASIRQNYQSAGKNANEILVAASDAPSDVIAQADFICSGSHDEVTIQNAIDAFVTGKKSCIRLSKGIFNIDAFPNYLATDEGDTYTAIALPNTGTLPEIRIFGSGNRAGGGSTTRLNITQTAHSTIVSNAQYKVIGGKSFQYSYGSKCCVLLSDFDIYLNSNQYPILGIDMSLVNRVKIDRIFMMATTAGKLVEQPRPVDGCIGLRMTSGSNWGTENDYRNISVYGFYEGFQVGGESVLAENLCSINAVYGYTFGNYPWQDSFNHKIVMIGIADERMENLPLFAESGYASSTGSAANTPFEVVLLGYSTEFIAPVWSNNAINYATESHPNGYCGVITYTHETGVRANQVNIPFWAAGMGKNFKTSNSAQLEVTTKAVLKTYAPNYNQIVYCTDLQKPLICTEPSTKEWRDFMGNVVNINS